MSYIKVRIASLNGASGTLSFPLFINVGTQKFVQVFKAGDPIDKDRLANYSQKGITDLFFRKEDRKTYIQWLIVLLTQEENLNLTALRDLAIRVMDDIFETGHPEKDSVKWLNLLCQTFSESFLMESKALKDFLDFDKEESYLSQQAVMSMVFTIAIAVSAGITNMRALEVLGTGALLHDIGMSQLNVNTRDLRRPLTTEEWKEVRQHPILGVTALLNANTLNSEVTEIVYQHHERWDGTGYPRGLKERKIALSARIVGIADSLAAMMLPGGGRERLEWNEALQEIVDLEGAYDPVLAEHVQKTFKIKEAI